MKKNHQLLFITIAAAFLFSLGLLLSQSSLLPHHWLAAQKTSQPAALAEEVYPLFACPCCGRPIEADCCEMAEERMAYVGQLVEKNLAKEEVIIAYVKKYGLDSFREETKKEEFRQKLIEAAPPERPIIQIEPLFQDLGDVSQEDGLVTTVFGLRNTGGQDLIISRLETSCGCTSAAIVYQGKEGPRFTMAGHGLNQKNQDWQLVIPPNQTAELKVYYDPSVHGRFRGPAIRDIYIFSNDPIEFEKKVRIELNQVD